MVYLFNQLEPDVKHQPVPLYVDNSGVISLVQNPVDHQANKHIRVSCHYAREMVSLGVTAPQRVSTESNLADIFTKPLGGVTFRAVVGHYVKSPAVDCSRGGVDEALTADPPKVAQD